MRNDSKSLLDIYSFSHITHGILFYLFFSYLKIDFWRGLFLTIIFEFMWEMFENTETIICLYRKKYVDYEGDSELNILGDMFSTVVGYIFASKTIYGSVLYLIISEILLFSYKASFLELSFGSLLNTDLSKCK